MQVNRLESWPVRAQVFESLVSVSVMATVSTAVVPSATDGVVSAEAYVGVWSLTSVKVTVNMTSEVEPSALVALTVIVHVLPAS